MRLTLLLAAMLSAAGADAQPPPDASLRAFLQTQVDRGLEPDVRYTSAFIDLDGDRRPEAVAQILGPHHCGTGGCGLLVLQQRSGGWRVVTALAIGHPPIRMLRTRSHGWRDLGVIVAGGGGPPAYEARLRFDGATYPDNPSVPPAVELRRGVPGRVLIARSDPGRRLF